MYLGRKKVSKYYEVKDDIENICLDCHHVGFTHAEHEIEGQDEAEVVCPKCYSTYYFVISKEERANVYRDWETDRKSTRLNSSHRL